MERQEHQALMAYLDLKETVELQDLQETEDCLVLWVLKVLQDNRVLKVCQVLRLQGELQEVLV